MHRIPTYENPADFVCSARIFRPALMQTSPQTRLEHHGTRSRSARFSQLPNGARGHDRPRSSHPLCLGHRDDLLCRTSWHQMNDAHAICAGSKRGNQRPLPELIPYQAPRGVTVLIKNVLCVKAIV